MLGHLYESQDCSAARALELVGERWSLLILRDAMFRGHKRFSEFEKTLQIAPNILSKRLAGFVEAGLMTLEAGEYRVTRKGLELKTALIALTNWGDKWVTPGPIGFIGAVDGARIGLRVVDETGRDIDVEDITVIPVDRVPAE